MPTFRTVIGLACLFLTTIASALDTVEIDGQKLPQGLMGSIGFEISW